MQECAWCRRPDGRPFAAGRYEAVLCPPCSIILERGDDDRVLAFYDAVVASPRRPARAYVGDRPVDLDEARRLLEAAARSDQIPTLTRAELRRRLDDGESPLDLLEWLQADLGAE